MIVTGLPSAAYLPLIAKGKAIGSLIVASRNRSAYGQTQIALLEQISAQVAIHIENSRIHAEVEEKARIDNYLQANP